MIIKSQDISNNPENEKKYTRIIYWCQFDDVWVNIETPKGE